MTSSSLDEYPGHFFTSTSSSLRGIIRNSAACSCGFGPYTWAVRGEEHREHVLSLVRADALLDYAKAVDHQDPDQLLCWDNVAQDVRDWVANDMHISEAGDPR